MTDLACCSRCRAPSTWVLLYHLFGPFLQESEAPAGLVGQPVFQQAIGTYMSYLWPPSYQPGLFQSLQPRGQ